MSFKKINKTKVKCSHCEREVTPPNLAIHESTCYLNPVNLKECPVCSDPIKNYKTSKTCGYSCSNTMFRSGNDNPNWSGNNYQLICFNAHGKECLVCGENNIVAAHHVNHDHYDNRPENIVPLCPTHHQYVHNRFADQVTPIIDKYLETFSV